MPSKQLIGEVTIRINKKKAIKKATSKPYKKRDKSQIRNDLRKGMKSDSEQAQ